MKIKCTSGTFLSIHRHTSHTESRAVLPIVLSLFFVFIHFPHVLQGQTQLYVKGALLTIREGGLLHIEGDFHLDKNGNASTDKGQFHNDGLLQVRGDFRIESDNVEQLAMATPSNGTVRLKNYDASWNSHAVLDNRNQRIFIGADAVADSTVAFNRLEIENENRGAAGSAGSYVDIGYAGTGIAIVEVKSQLVFNNDSRFVTADASTGARNDGSDYPCELFVSSPDPGAIDFNGAYSATPMGYRLNAGADTRYVEGVLRRTVSGTNSYYFPIGLSPGFEGSDGMAAFHIDVSGAGGQVVRSFVNSGDVTDLVVKNVFADVGEDPGLGEHSFGDCSGGPDGIYDLLQLNQAMSYEWQVENLSVTDFDYDIEFYPGDGLNGTLSNSTTMFSCGPDDFVIRYLAKDGRFFDRDTGDEIAFEAAPGPFDGAGYGYRYDPPESVTEGNQQDGLSSFSVFRIFSALDAETFLPVELVHFTAEVMDNSYVRLHWETATEINNDYFEVQRSLDALHWRTIAREEGAGNSTIPLDYSVNDRDVDAGVLYYYRLVQTDFDGTSTVSPVRPASLTAIHAAEFTARLYPNPVAGNAYTGLQLYGWDGQSVQLLVLDMSGRILYKEPIQIEEQQSMIRIPTENMASGSYLVAVHSPSDIYHTTLIISQ